MADFEYEIVKSFGVLSDNKGYTKEVNLVSYNKREPVLDIRTWYTGEDGNKKMTKGVTISAAELPKLKEILASM